jgi:hypothetical protein
MPTRKGPTESANDFSIGTKKRGNDGNMWVIIQTKNSKRWSKVNNTKKTNNKGNNQGNNQTKKYTIHKSKKNDISVDKLKQLLKKYNVTTSGSKEKMAQGLVRVSNFLIESKDLELIYTWHRDYKMKKCSRPM